MIWDVQKGLSGYKGNFELLGAPGSRVERTRVWMPVTSCERAHVHSVRKRFRTEMRWSNLYFRRIPGVFLWSVDKLNHLGFTM